MKYFLSFLFFFTIGLCQPLSAQKLENVAIKKQIQQYKKDAKGPYKDIRWFCPDGSIIMPKEKCAEKGGVQRARYKEEVEALAKSNHIFLGQILSKTEYQDFWDSPNYNARLKQYQLEKYLRGIDDGWVLQKGQYYRGAFQVEDEEAWGIEFFTWLLTNEAMLNNQFFLIRQAAKDIPHQGDDSRTQNVRSLSKVIADAYPAFQDLRIKIHGQPDATDIPKVQAFKEKHTAKLNASLRQQFDDILADMEIIYAPVDLRSLNKYLKSVPKESKIYQSLNNYINTQNKQTNSVERVMATAERLWDIRENITVVKSRKARLALLDISNILEELYFRESAVWETNTLQSLMDKICYSGLVAVGTGFVEKWEWEKVSGNLAVPKQDKMSLLALQQYLETARSLVEWGTGMTKGVYQDVVNLYGGFEPLAQGFYDDRIRGSVLLALGQDVGKLGDIIAKEANFSNQVLNIANQSNVRGLNPGYAFGELVVVENEAENLSIDKNKIYIFNRPSADLKPVAGIATVSEGNMVSHVQLLARNLGIPNAVISDQNLQDLKKYAGQKVFYAVSNKGTVIMKLERQMTATEQRLFSVKKRSEDKITVPVEKIDLNQTQVLNLRDIDAKASGRLCGPKAANLGQLKAMFPEKVVGGIVIPFGIFRQHLNQKMYQQEVSYWQYLTAVFKKATAMQEADASEDNIESYVLKELEIFREAIKHIRFRVDFLADLKESFANTFGKEMGKVPVFLRSDTNMEDLKDFTGAGLNLTVFNVLDAEKITQGIKDVWASPYTERSFKWRQRYLLNPENVFPSILIIPSVDVEYSGVLITKGIPTGDGRDLTVAFNRGAGGAVDGQAAESWLLNHNNQNLLIAPAREPSYRSLPNTGGSLIKSTTFENPILKAENLYDLRVLAYEINKILPTTAGIETQGPFDVELGFKNDKIWLFQVRPFVENKNALTSSYLESISPKINTRKLVSMVEKIN